MANQIDPADMMARLVAIENEIVNSDAFDYPFVKGEGYPYWTNYMPTLALDRSANTFGEEVTDAVPTIMATLAIGRPNAESEAKYTQFAFDASRYFNQRPKMQSQSYPTGMPYTHYLECTNVTHAIGSSGEGGQVLLANFTLVLHLFEPLAFAYY